MLRHRPDRRVPGFGVFARGVVDRQALVLADLRSAAALRRILVLPRRPVAFDVDLA